MPTIPSITTSVENQQTLILDPHAKNGVFKKDSRGRLIKHSGGFTVVYPYSTNSGEKWAFRCWHSELGNAKKRFETISSAIQRSNLPFLCDFIYNDKGINVEGKVYPTTRMKWVEGETIKKYICENHNSQKKLLNVANLFLNMLKEMHQHSLAHGDLQHGNILVGTDEKLYLVDYDSFYCPELKGEKDIITGLKDYQHPSRSKNVYVSEKIDYFSELIIYISLLGIAYNPSLCKKYQVEDTERLLFEVNDFYDLKNSQIYKDLNGLNPIFTPLLEILNIYLKKSDIQDLEPFDLMLEKMTQAPEILRFDFSPQNNLYEGDKINLNWSVKGYSHLYLNEREIKSSKAIRKLSVGDNLFTLKVSNDFKETSKTIKVQALEIPKIKLSTSKQKLKAHDQEEITINWHVTNATEIYLEYDSISEKVINSSQKKFVPTETTEYKIRAIGKDGQREFYKTVFVNVFEEANVSFCSDRKYTLPDMPIKLLWNVEHAKDVELKGYGKVDAIGSQSVTTKVETKYTLIVTDEFETKEYEVEVKMLPLPTIKTINVPVPELNKKLNIVVNVPKMEPKIVFPDIKLLNVDIKVQTNEKYNLSHLFDSIKTSSYVNLLTEIKSLFTHYYNKLNHGKKK